MQKTVAIVNFLEGFIKNFRTLAYFIPYFFFKCYVNIMYRYINGKVMVDTYFKDTLLFGTFSIARIPGFACLQ